MAIPPKADASEVIATFVTGIANDKGSLTVGFNYQNREAIFNRDRSYSQTPPFLSSNSSPPNLQLSRAAVNDALGQPASAAIPGVPAVDSRGRPVNVFFGSTFANRTSNSGNLPASAYAFSTGRSSVYNFNESSGSFPESDRVGGFATFERKIFNTDNVRVYGDFIFQQFRSVNELAPSATGDFFNPGGVTIVIPARTPSPILTPDEVAAGGGRTAPAGAFNPFNPFNQDISGASRARLAEFGNRVYRDQTQSFLTTVGLRADDLFERWNFDAGFRYSRIDTTSDNTLVSISRLNRVLNAADPIFNPASSQYIGTTTPYNPFGFYQNPIAGNTAVVRYASVVLHDNNNSDLGMGYFLINTAELFALPAGNVGFAFGGDYRKEQLKQSPDALGLTGDVIGSSTANITNAQRQIGALFTEFELPILTGVPGARSLSLNLAARYEEFVTSKREAFVPKVGIKWLPFDETFVVRGTWGRGFREPSLYELYAGGLTYTLTPVSDPANADPVTGVAPLEPEQSASIASNRRLEAEDSENYNLGLVWTPNFLKGFTVALDAWNIERKNTVTVSHQDIVNRDFRGQALLPGEKVVRDNAGNILQVDGIFRNVGGIKTRGLDIATSYVLATDNLGRFDFGVNATYIHSHKEQDFPGAPFIEYIGQATDILYDPSTGEVVTPGLGEDAYLKWRGQAFVGWAFAGVSTTVTANYNDGFRDYDAAGEERKVEEQVTYDVQAAYTLFAKNDSWYGDTTITAGVRNLFDTPPPFVSGFGGNSTGYSGFLYNSEGRFYYLSLTKRL